MTFLHFRFTRRLGLLAAGVLNPTEASFVRSHIESCPSCRTELQGLERADAALRADAAIGRALPISSEALQTRVFARLREAPSSRPVVPAWSLASSLSAAGLIGIGLLAGILAARLAPLVPEVAPVPVGVSLEDAGETASNNDAFYARLEKTHLRADAARYLEDAQDVLVQMRAAADCPDSPQDSVDVAQEARTSRTLLKRRAALVSGSGETLLAARGVMEEVEGLLQQVAELPQCTRRSEVAAIARNVERKNLLMKIDMVAQELAAP